MKAINGIPIVRHESDASCVYDFDANEVVAYAPGVYWSLAKSKALRERGTGHKCYYLGWPQVVAGRMADMVGMP